MKTELMMMSAMCSLIAVAAPEWEDLATNSINRLAARTYSMPLADEKAALTDALEPETPYKLSLNGDWKFSWAGNPELRIKDFWKTDFDDSKWFTIDVPSCVETRGFGSPGYTNVRYPHANAWPKILDCDTLKPDYNPVSSYRTTFTIPQGWVGRDVILRFDGVYSAYYVWVNGKRVGYAEDSKLPSEFDITQYLQPGKNLLCVEVYRWCDGSYLEDQDMFRYSGIFRDVTLWAKPKDGIWDFTVKTSIDGSIAVDCPGATWKLYDANFKEVSTPVKDVQLWSAEKPYLYTLVLKKGVDIRMKRVGFKEQKIVGNAFTVNGKKIKFKGVNRHECSADNGRTVSQEEMLSDIMLMKRYNINTVRTCHYPDHHLWYDLCDRYGIYLCAEANVEGHGAGYTKDGALGSKKEFDHTIVERNERHVKFYRNHPSVTIWSMGNETGHGDCFRHAISAVKSIDPSRPVHWERGNPDADVDSKMYPSVEWLEARGKAGDNMGDLPDEKDPLEQVNHQTKGKCFFMCEYAHAMGNSIGNFQEYWDAYYRYDSLAGGCIWDWVDQAIWKYTDKVDPKTGKRERFLAYGGDFDEEPNDGPFCDNGVVDPLRNVSAKLVEVGHVHRNLVVTRSVGNQGDNPFAVVFELWNRHAFTRADEFLGVWKLRENGKIIKVGAFETPALEPLSRCRFTVSGMSEALASAAAGAELFVDFEFQLKQDEPWAKKGWVVARDQVAIGGSFVVAQGDPITPVISQDDKTVNVEFADTKAVFCRKSGTLCELKMKGKTILRDPVPGVVCGPRFTCERAFTDNDRWIRDGSAWFEDRKTGGFYSRGLTQLRYHARNIEIDGNKVKIEVEVVGAKSAGFTHRSIWSFLADGSVEVANTVIPHGTMPSALPRMGLSLRLDPSLENVEYYGRGPEENYIDRCTGSFFGLWKTTVTDMYEPYVRPQDNGYRVGVRYVDFTDAKGVGVRCRASEPLFVQALHYGLEDLEFARHRAGQKRIRCPLTPSKDVYLNLDVRQLGLGGASCGPKPMDKYIFPIENMEWKMTLSPVALNREK